MFLPQISIAVYVSSYSTEPMFSSFNFSINFN